MRCFKSVTGMMLLGSLALATQGIAADQDIQQKLDSLSKEVDALKQQVTKTEKKSLGRWLEIGGDYRFRYDYLRGSIAPYADGLTFMDFAQKQMTQVFNDTYNLQLPQLLGSNVQAYMNTHPGVTQAQATQAVFQQSQQQAASAAQTAQQAAAAQATDPQVMAMMLQASGAMKNGGKVNNESLYTNRFGLNLKAKATKDITVTTRLLMYKIAGAQDDSALRTGNTAYSFDRAGLFDGTIGHVPGDSRLAVDRVYATWNNIAEQPIWFSIGRRPSTGGVPSNLRQNTEKPGVSGVPSLLIDYAFDGVTLGYAPDIEALPGAYGKICYGRGFQNSIKPDEGNGLHNTDLVGINLVPYETDSFRAEFQYNRGMNIFDAPTMLSGPFALKTGKNIGDIDWFGLDFLGKVKNVGPGSLNWFVSGAMNQTHNNGNTLTFGGMDTGSGLLFTGKPDNVNGWAVFAGGRYDLNASRTKLGFEYNHGSKNWLTFAPAADDMWTSKVGTRGNVYEGYLIQELPLEAISSYLSKAFFRIGYQYYDFEYTGSNSWLGTPVRIADLNSSIVQLTAPVKNAQDVYATFEVHF